MSTPSNSLLCSALSESAMFRDYQDAYEKAVGLPLTLHAPEEVNAVRPGPGSPFCALTTRCDHACKACVAMQVQLEQEARLQPRTLQCFAGFCETAVPVRVGEDVIAFLQTGRVLLEKPNERHFEKITGEMLRSEPQLDLKQFEEAYYGSRVFTPEQYEAMVRLLGLFATQLATCGNQLLLQRPTPDDSPVSRAQQIIAEGFRDELSMGDIARRVSVSATYFSMLFKKVTGLNFVDYVARFRVEKAKTLLQNPNYRINEVAFNAGFQSLSQFNRTFHRVVGTTPRDYRTTLVQPEIKHDFPVKVQRNGPARAA